MTYQFESPFNRRKRSAKWENIPTDVISMTIADMDFPIMPEVGEAINCAIKDGDFGYQFLQEKDYQAVLDWVKKRTGKEVQREYLINTPGVLYTMRCAMYALTNEGDKVVVQTPLHTPSIKSASMMGRQEIKNWLVYENGRYTMDFDHLEKSFRDGAKVLMMCAPNNPTGRVWSKEEMDTIAYLADKYNVFVVSDEIHRDIIWDGNKHISPVDIPLLKDRSVSVFSTSKTFNMGGFHIGSAVIPNAEIRTKVTDMLYNFGYAHGMATVLDREAQTAAYTYGENWYQELMNYVEGNFTLALDMLDGLPIYATKPEATTLLWVDISELGLDAEGLRNKMSKWKVYGDPGSYYDTKDWPVYDGAEHHIRLNLATQRSVVEEAFNRIRKALLL